MSEVANVVAAIMRADSDALRVAANNVSNAQGVAYRRQVQVRHLDFEGVAAAHGTVLQPELPRTEVVVDTRPGTLRSTGEPLDVAIQGDGYFVVDTSAGELLTRRGDFHVDQSGVLNAYTGDPVLGTEGVIRVPSGAARIAADGTVRVGATVAGHLRVVQPDSNLTARDDGLFAAAGGAALPASTTAQLHQGFLETSNVQPVQEMMHMMETVRHFEAGQRYMRAYDEMLDKAISDLGRI